MTKFKSFLVNLNGKEVYRAKERVKGAWTVEIGEEVKVDSVYVSFHGKTFVKWDDGLSKEKERMSYEGYTYQSTKVAGKENDSAPSLVLKPGLYTYPFDFFIPDDKMPSSFEGRYGATRWFVQITIHRPMLWPTIIKQKCVTFLDNVDLNYVEYSKPVTQSTSRQLSKAFGIGDDGHVTLKATINRTGFCPGEHISISVDAQNNSQKDLGNVQAKLVQEVVYWGNAETNKTVNVLRTLNGGELIKGSNVKWENRQFTVDAVPLSRRRRSCYAIKIDYFLKVSVAMPGLEDLMMAVGLVIFPVPFYSGGDIELKFPIVIGSKPVGYKPASVNSKTGARTVESHTMTYVKCNSGWKHFCESLTSENFQNDNYTPMCSYVTSYSPHPTAAKLRATGNGSTQRSQKATTGSGATPFPQEVTTGSGTTQLPQKAALPQTNLAIQTPERPRVLPSAPPSYEEVVKHTQRESGAVESKDAFMIFRFQTNKSQEYNKHMMSMKQSIEKFNGKITVLPSKVIRASGYYTSDVLIGIVIFTSKNHAKDWLKSTPGMGNTDWLEQCDIVIAESKERFQRGKLALNLTELEIKTSTPDKLSQLVQIRDEHMTPHRLAVGGTVIVSTKEIDTLRGSWTLLKEQLIITAWNKHQDIPVYKNIIPESIYKKYTELLQECYKVKGSTVIAYDDVENLPL